MGCRQGKAKAKRRPGNYRCRDCGSVVKAKSEVCEPKKIKPKKIKE